MTVTIRAADAGDETRWRALWSAYLQFYQTALPQQVSDLVWERILDPSSRLSCQVAVVDGTVVGFATWHHHVATWHAADDCYLEDLFVDPALRGSGIGRALLDDLVATARARGFGRLYWHTKAGNAQARKLYDRYAQADDHLRYRMAL